MPIEPQPTQATSAGADLAQRLSEGQRHLAAGRLDAAAGIAEQLLQRHADHINSWLFAGLVARRQGRLEAAITTFRAAAERNPRVAEPWRQLGNALTERGDAAGAEAAYRQGLALQPDDVPLLNNLGVVLRKSGRPGPAAETLRRAVGLRPDHADAWFNLGNALAELDRITDAGEAYEQVLRLQPDRISGGLRLAQVYQSLNRVADAERLFERLQQLAPDNIAARRGIRAARAKAVPQWHFPMMNDAARNEAYRIAIERAAARRRAATGAAGGILDIGTGAGMLAMIAARTGFAPVHTCEMVPAVAAAAGDVIARNGLADKVTLLGKSSNDLVPGQDLPGTVSLLVTETFDSLLLGEDILRTMDHARACLLAPGAQVIPAAGAVMGALIGGAIIAEQMFAQTVLGFDLSAFNRFASLKAVLPIDLLPHRLMSEAVEILRFEFPGDRHIEPGRSEAEFLATADGECAGVAQWIRLYLDSETIYENRPDNQGRPSSWLQILHAFPQPTQLRAGDRLRFAVEHNRVSVDIELLQVIPAGA